MTVDARSTIRIMSLTEEDKQWLSELLDSKVSGLDSKVLGLDSKVSGLDSKVAGLDSKISRLDSALDKKISLVHSELNHKIDHLHVTLREEFLERLEAMETRLLTAFHDWASPREQRLRSHSAALAAFDAELEELRKRIEKLEKNQAA